MRKKNKKYLQLHSAWKMKRKKEKKKARKKSAQTTYNMHSTQH